MDAGGTTLKTSSLTPGSPACLQLRMSRINIETVVIQVLLRGPMYVCVCHAVTDRDIAQAVADGASSMRDLRERTGVAGTCGRCAQCAHACLKEASAAKAKTITLFRTEPNLSVA